MPEIATLSEKSVSVEIKTNSTPGEFTAVISAIGNVDHDGDKVMPHAFEKAISEDPIPPVYWAHKHEIPPIGEGLEWYEKGNEITYEGRLFVKGDVTHQFADMVYAGMKSYDGRAPAIRQFSYTYGVPQGGAERVIEGGKAIRLLHEVRPVAEVGPCFLGANSHTRILEAAKAIDLGAEARTDLAHGLDWFGTKAPTLSDEDVEAMPDTAFLLIDGENRYCPYRGKDGEINLALLRMAIEQAPTLEVDERLQGRVKTRAERLLGAHEAKALLLATTFASKCWEDISGYEVVRVLSMLDSAVSFIQFSEVVEDIDRMQSIAISLVAMLGSAFSAVGNSDASKTALDVATKAYKEAANSPLLSEATSMVKAQEIARLLLVRPTH